MADVYVGKEGAISDVAISGAVLKKWEKIYEEVINRIMSRINIEFPNYQVYYRYRPACDIGASEHKQIVIYKSGKLLGFIPWKRNKQVVANIHDMRLEVKLTVYIPWLVPIFKEELSRHADYMSIKKVNIYTE